MDANSARRVFRFGVFEADEHTGELRKQGRRLPLQGQPLQVLLVLLERPGELVSRAELHQRLWPEGTFVDFDHGLNTAINKIREALGDSASNPRFVETLPAEATASSRPSMCWTAIQPRFEARQGLHLRYKRQRLPYSRQQSFLLRQARRLNRPNRNRTCSRLLVSHQGSRAACWRAQKIYRGRRAGWCGRFSCFCN